MGQSKAEFELTQAELVGNYAWKVEFLPLLVGLFCKTYGERGSGDVSNIQRQSQEADFMRDAFGCVLTYLGHATPRIEALLYIWTGCDRRMIETYGRVYSWAEIAVGLQVVCERIKTYHD